MFHMRSSKILKYFQAKIKKNIYQIWQINNNLIDFLLFWIQTKFKFDYIMSLKRENFSKNTLHLLLETNIRIIFEKSNNLKLNQNYF